MEDPQEYKSLDELFRKTFEELPETPTPSGWDVPSPRVWEQVQANIPAPKSGWTTQSLLLLSSMAVVLLLGLYWALSRPDQPDNDAPPTTEQPAVAADTPIGADQPERAASVAEIPVAVPAPLSAPTQRRHPDTATKTETLLPADGTEEEPTLQRPAGSIPLPGTAQAPNTTIRRQMEELRNAPWAQPLEPLPNSLKWQQKTVPQPLQPIRH